MTYLAQSKLESDPAFSARCRAALTEQSLVFKDSQLPDLQALAGDLLRNAGAPTGTFLRMLAGAPGFADEVDVGDGQINSSLVSDANLLAAVQADFPVVAALYFDSEGEPHEPAPSH
jgi:hypothetical protein